MQLEHRLLAPTFEMGSEDSIDKIEIRIDYGQCQANVYGVVKSPTTGSYYRQCPYALTHAADELMQEFAPGDAYADEKLISVLKGMAAADGKATIIRLINQREYAMINVLHSPTNEREFLLTEPLSASLKSRVRVAPTTHPRFAMPGEIDVQDAVLEICRLF